MTVHIALDLDDIALDTHIMCVLFDTISVQMLNQEIV